MNFRIGHGFDVHAFGGEGPVVLGGVTIPHEKGLIAFSDGDVILHALADSLLGAVGLGDIGRLYPDTDKQFENIDSRILLRDTVARLKSLSYAIGNVDITVLAQAPKISKYHELMRKNIAADLEIDEDRVNIKATTTEKLGFVGRKEGIAVEAVALVYKV